MAKQCPAMERRFRCGKVIGDRMFVCTGHWKTMPGDVREAVALAQQQYFCDEISRHDMDLILADALAWINNVNRARTAPVFVTAAATPGFCSCGRRIFFPTNWTHDGQPALTEDASGGFVIIGGQAIIANGHGPSYTRFAHHWCPPFGEREERAADTPRPPAVPRRNGRGVA